MAYESYIPPSGVSGAVALSHTVPTVIGGTNQNRRSIVVLNNDPSQMIWVCWANPSAATTADYVKANGFPLQYAGSVPFNASLASNGTGGTAPVLYGIADTADQVSPADTRWSEQG